MANENYDENTNKAVQDNEGVEYEEVVFEDVSETEQEGQYEEEYEEEVAVDEFDRNDIIEDDNELSEEELEPFARNLSAYTVFERNIEVRKDSKAFKSALTKSIILNALLVFLLLVMVAAFTFYPKTKYIPTKDNTAICEVYPEDNPNLTDAAISEFAKDGVLNLYTFDYINYEQQMNATLDRFFTPQGRAATVQAISEAELADYARDKALTFRASAINAVRIEQSANDKNGRAYWIVRFPMVLDIYSGSLTPIDSQRHMVTVRVSADTASVSNPRGLGISSVSLERMNN